MTNNQAALMAKWPQEREVKTRLADSIGHSAALEVYLSLLRNVSENCLPSNNNHYQLCCFVEPEKRVDDFAVAFPGFLHYAGQLSGNLGERMHHALTELFKQRYATRALLIGADIPNLDSAVIAEAFSRLDKCDVVFGPTTDGGYYLTGMNCLQPKLFTDIAWGTSEVLSASLSRASELGLAVELLGELSDLDSVDDLKLFPALAKSAGLSIDLL